MYWMHRKLFLLILQSWTRWFFSGTVEPASPQTSIVKLHDHGNQDFIISLKNPAHACMHKQGKLRTSSLPFLTRRPKWLCPRLWKGRKASSPVQQPTTVIFSCPKPRASQSRADDNRFWINTLPLSSSNGKKSKLNQAHKHWNQYKLCTVRMELKRQDTHQDKHNNSKMWFHRQGQSLAWRHWPGLYRHSTDRPRFPGPRWARFVRTSPQGSGKSHPAAPGHPALWMESWKSCAQPIEDKWK